MLPPPCSLSSVCAVAVIALVFELVQEFPALFERGVFLFVHIHQFLPLNEELRSSGYTLLRRWVDEGFGERGETFRVVHDEGGGIALRFEVGGRETVEETGKGRVDWRGDVVGLKDGKEVCCGGGGGQIREGLLESGLESGDEVKAAERGGEINV